MHRFFRVTATIILLLSTAHAGGDACAMWLGEAVNRALQSDPVFLAAQANLNVSRERSAQALSNLLPQLTATANTTLNRRDYKLSGNNNSVQEKYNSNAVQLNLTQPVWQRAKRIAVTQAGIVVEQSDYQLAAAEQDLLMRLAQAWFDTMQARDAVTFSAAQVPVAKQQWEQAVRGKELGLMSVTELEDMRAKYDQAIADQASAESEQEIKLAAFEQIVGAVATPTPPFLRDQFTPPDFLSDTLEQWLAKAENSSPSILAAQRALAAADEEVRKQRSGHELTLDIVAAYGNSAQGAGISGGQAGFDSRLNTLGFQFNMPLYAGGGQSARVREADALREKARHELESARRTARSNIKQAWFIWHAGHARQQSALQAVKSTAFAVKGAESEKARGLKIDIDILQARQKREGAQRDLQKARYDMITSYFKLKAATGKLTGSDLADLDKEFEEALIPDNQISPSFPRRRESSENNAPRSGQNPY